MHTQTYRMYLEESETLLTCPSSLRALTSHIIDENGDAFRHVTDENHRIDFVRSLAFFMNQGEVDVQSISNGCHSEGQ